MISKDIQMKLLKAIRENMIPEYNSVETSKKKLKEEFVRYVKEDRLSKEDEKLISKYPDYIKYVDTIDIMSYYYYRRDEGIEVRYPKVPGSYKDDLLFKLDEKLPKVCDYIYSLKTEDKKEWKKIGPVFYQFVNSRNSYIKKINLAYEFLSHKNTTLTLIKNEFPELYKFYKS